MPDAFHHLRQSFCHVSLLHVLNSADVFTLHTDASGHGVGATLNVERNGHLVPVAYFARQLHCIRCIETIFRHGAGVSSNLSSNPSLFVLFVRKRVHRGHRP